MKQGRTLTQLAQELDRQKDAKQDFVVDTRQLTMLGGFLDENGVPQGSPELHFPDGVGEFPLNSIAERQIGTHLKMPAKFWDLLRAEHPTLLSHNVNTLFRERPARRTVRCFDFGDGDRTARAFLSDRYLRRDNYDVAQAALKVLSDIPDVQIPTSQITDRHMYLTALAPRVTGEVKVGDQVQAGIRITNSEVGHGALKIEPIVYRLICLNGMTVAKATRVFHVGGTVDGDETLQVLSQETERLDDQAFFAKLADVMRAAVDETQFNAIVAQMREAAGTAPMAKPLEGMTRLASKFAFTQDEQESVLSHLIEGGDLTAWGALNAVTRAAQDVDSYDRSMELEQVGGQILEMAGSREWEAVAAAR